MGEERAPPGLSWRGYNSGLQPFVPLIPHGHFQTLAASVWPRGVDWQRRPVEAILHQAGPDVRVLVHVQQPECEPLGEAVLVHGMEGSSDSPYMVRMADAALEAGLVVHRFNLRGCGGTEFLAPTFYHGGLTSDLLSYLLRLDRDRRTPVYLIGFSLGGNVVLKLAGELGDDGDRLIAGVCAVSAPVDLEASARRLAAPANWLYQWRLLRGMRQRLELVHRAVPDLWPIDGLDRVRTVLEFDARFTAPWHGFASAGQYYRTQSAAPFLPQIRVPVLIVHAKDDPIVPFRQFEHAALDGNPAIELAAPDSGGHLGFLSWKSPRFWLPATVIAWILEKEQELGGGAVS